MKKELKTEQKEYSLKGSCLWGLLLFGVLLLVDMLTKIFADAYFSQPDAPERVAIIPEYLELCIARNRGISFSMGSTATPAAKIGLIVATCVMFVAIGWYYFKTDKRRTWVRVALVLIVAGGIGNLIDRVYYRVWDPASFPAGVRDMVRLKIFIFDFGVCNFADFFIVGGAIVLILAILFFDGAAMFPLTKKYKALAEEERAKEEAKEAEKSKKAAEKAREKAAARQENQEKKE
ncbi:MAG: signal peptidase II [Clostridiales bacterium]|nr:signal peptidase II [Clostridiales bacterium]